MIPLLALLAVSLHNPPPAQASLAMNLAGPADWNTELPFVDLFRFTREWISQEEGKAWGQGPKLEVDGRGWVRRLPPGVFAETFLTSYENHYPAGDYTVLYDGDGDLAFGNGAVTASAKGRMVLKVDPKRGPFNLQLRRTNPANPVRNIRVLLPGTEATYRTDPFNPAFLKRWQGVSALRFMDWMQTNDSKIRSWGDRPRLDDASWAPKGIPAEIMIDLANRMKADAWFCVPHLADDGYVRSFAKLAAGRLDPSLRVYLEYSNEVWNGQFQQQRYAGDQGLKAGVGEKHWEAGWHWYARRSGQIFDLWSAAFPKTRLVRVLASQAGNAYVSDQILGFEGAAKKADALAIAPYMGFMPSPTGEPKASEVAGWSLDRLFATLREKTLPESIGFIRDNKKVATRYGLPLIAYEGGQHLVGVAGGENDESLTKLLNDANRDPRMGALYDDYLKAWQKEGGGLFANFSSIGPFSKWGSWGQLEYADDNPAKAPKLAALRRWAKSLGQF
ncbi:hypothetical protein BH11ARM2_BH11ARM2_14170 [soil metagenome]